MAELVLLCGVSELPAENQVKGMAANGHALCVARVNGTVTALDNICPHRGGPLSEGWVEDGKVVCPWHAWCFDPETGAVNGDSAERITVYPTRIEGDSVFVEVPPSAPGPHANF